MLQVFMPYIASTVQYSTVLFVCFPDGLFKYIVSPLMVKSSISVCHWMALSYMSSMWDELSYQLASLNDCTVKVWEWISNFIQH